MNARLRLVEPIPVPPAEAALEAAILAGFERRHASANHRPVTIRTELAKVAAFRAFVGAPPWAWRAEHLDAYGKVLRERQLARESIRSKQGAIRRFLDFARDPAYDWAERCFAATGQSIRQIASRDNTVRHQYGAPTTKRRNLTDTELAQLFLTVRTAIAAAARGCDQRTSQMHYAVLQFGLGFGCREHEIEMGDLADLAAAASPQIRAYSAFEDFSVRFGKSHDGGPSKRRSVVATYPFRDAFAVLAWYLREVRPRLVRPASPNAIFLGVRGGRLRGDSISAIFAQYRRAAGLSPDLTFHCLRHTYGTILRECGFELGVIAHLLGHDDLRTTTLYDHLGSDFLKQRLLACTRQIICLSEQCRP